MYGFAGMKNAICCQRSLHPRSKEQTSGVRMFFVYAKQGWGDGVSRRIRKWDTWNYHVSQGYGGIRADRPGLGCRIVHDFKNVKTRYISHQTAHVRYLLSASLWDLSVGGFREPFEIFCDLLKKHPGYRPSKTVALALNSRVHVSHIVGYVSGRIRGIRIRGFVSYPWDTVTPTLMPNELIDRDRWTSQEIHARLGIHRQSKQLSLNIRIYPVNYYQNNQSPY